MAATSLASWEPLLSCSKFGAGRSRQNRSAHDSCGVYRRFSRSYHGSPLNSFNAGPLQMLSSRTHNQSRLLRQARIPGHSRRGDRVQVFCVVTEKIVSGTQLRASAQPSVRRLILLRHAKSSWTDPSLKVIHDIISAAPTSRSRISRIWSKMEKSWASDHDRPLSKRGRLAASNIAVKLQEHSGWEPQLILCSDSARTRETLSIMQQELACFSEAEIRYFSSFYCVAAMDGQTLQHLQDIICKYSKDDVTTIMCMGHNKGWEEAASLLSGMKVELKTANAALLETHGSSWQEAFEGTGMGDWKLIGIVKPDTSNVEDLVQ